MTSENVWSCDGCTSINCETQLNCKTCYKDKLTVENLIIRIILEKEKYYENLPSNLEPNFRYKADLLFKLLNHPKFGPYLEESFKKDKIQTHLIDHTLTNYVVLEDAINFLQNTCIICLTDFPMDDMCVLNSCNCEFCYSCLKEWLKEMIYNKPTKDWYCPSCPQKPMNENDKNLHFFSFQRIINSDENLKSLFHDKLLNEYLESNAKFCYCKNLECSVAFEKADDFQIKISCPNCKCYTCTHCKVKWHENETCEQYQIRKVKDDPNLSQLMNKIGIECPKCHVQFAFAKGGCLHVKCKHCELEFCECCKKEFLKGKCKIQDCVQTGLHADHPRNCAYYTRDRNIKSLESILFKEKKLNKPKNSFSKTCSTIITDNNFKDSKCPNKCYKDIEYCHEHYKNYLCLLIFNYNIDMNFKQKMSGA